jgi:hypothetical protein
LIFSDEDNFKNITEEAIDRAIEKECLPPDVFNRIKKDVVDLMKM